MIIINNIIIESNQGPRSFQGVSLKREELDYKFCKQYLHVSKMVRRALKNSGESTLTSTSAIESLY